MKKKKRKRERKTGRKPDRPVKVRFLLVSMPEMLTVASRRKKNMDEDL